MYNNTPAAPPSAPNSNTFGKKAAIAVLILLVLLTLINVAFFFLRKSGDVAPLRTELTEKEQALSELETKYSAAITQLDSLKTILPGGNEQIEVLKAELEAKRADIEQNIRLKGDLTDARRQIDELVQQKDDAVLEVARLKEKINDLGDQVVALSTEKQQYESERQQYESGLSEVRNQLGEAQTAKAALLVEKTRLEQNNREQERQMEANRFLSVSGIKITTMAVNSKGKTKETSARKMIDQIKICFQVTQNPLLRVGEEKFYLKIVDPVGATVYREDQGSGVATDKESGEDFRYTAIATCTYQQQDTEVCGDWKIGADTPGKGQYTVEVFHRGRRVGSSTFKVR
jgi:cell division protein ZapB